VKIVPTLGINGEVALPLLANTYVVEDSAIAERLAALHPERHFLTRGGEHYHHRLVAGGRGPSAGPLALRRDLRELERRTSDLELKLERSQESARKLSEEVAALERELRTLNAAKLEAEKKTLIADEKVKQLRQALERATAQRNIVDRELANVEHEGQEIETRQSHLRAQITVASEEQARRETGISHMAELVRQSRTRLDHVRQELIGAQARSSALEERIRSFEGERATLSARLEEFGKKLKRVAEQCAAWDGEQQQIAAEVEQARARLGEVESEQNSAQGQLQELEQETRRARQRISELAPLIESARKALDEARERRSQADVAVARAESDLAHAARQCQQELDCNPEMVRSEFPPDQVVQGEALHAAEQELAELKARLEALGPVNMMALEELQEAEERYRFLEGQRQDLLASINDTMQAIREIDQVSRQQFLEAFAAINRYFAECFRILFAGGNGELRLSDESDPEGGIDMAAQPPGKRLQNVLLLSGGEKALAALALLIAMFRYTPSPFCILDEVDAPLDESNVDRFTRLISEMSTHTQFILITHNKRTMEIAKALYGVTMEEPGISKLVSVRMEEIAA
jgi:chromosome segregation protein